MRVLRLIRPHLFVVAALAPIAIVSAGTVSYRLERLDVPPAPGVTRFGQATAIDGGLIAGTTYSHYGQENATDIATIWTGREHRPLLLPGGKDQNTIAHAVAGDQIVGSLVDSIHAALWTDGGTKLLDLNPSGYHRSGARGAANGYQVGYADGDKEYAVVWHGSANDFIKLNGSLDSAQAIATDGRQVVGSTPNDAALWTSFSPSSYVNLAPQGSDGSEAVAVWNGYQVGSADFGEQARGIHAMLWHGSADSAIDLHPAEFAESRATAINNGIVVGSGTALVGPEEHDEALVWLDPLHGAPPINLSRFSDGASSNAWGIDRDGVIVGDVEGVPVRWVPLTATAIPLPPGVLSGTLLLAAIGIVGILLRRFCPASFC